MDGTRTWVGGTWAEWACALLGHAWDPFAGGERGPGGWRRPRGGGAGGTVARWIVEGHEGHALILGTGALARVGADVAEVPQLHAQAHAAAARLGLAAVSLQSFPGNPLDTLA